MGLREQLEALGLRKGTAHLPAGAARPARRRIEDLVPGEVLRNPAGECFVVQQRFDPEHRQGAAALHALWEQQPATLARLARDDAFLSLDPTHLVFLDTETTGLAGGTGTYAFLVGCGYFEPDRSFVVCQFFMRDYDEEPAQMAALSEALERFRAVVSFNGKAFDLPLLETRLALLRMANPLAGAAHLDLLFPARRLWRGALPSCALSALEVHVLDVRRGAEDVPGYIIPSLYFDYLRGGDAGPLVNVFWHNVQDILSMVALTTRLARALEAPLERAGSPEETLGIARMYEEWGLCAESERIYQAALAGPTPAEQARWAAGRLAALYKRAGRRDEAAALWQTLLDDGDAAASLEAYVELAKHYEWSAGDIAQAAEITRRAIGWARRWQRGPARRRSLAELEHRLSRLERKLAGKPPAGEE